MDTLLQYFVFKNVFSKSIVTVFGDRTHYYNYCDEKITTTAVNTIATTTTTTTTSSTIIIIFIIIII